MNIEERIIGGFSLEGGDRVGKATQVKYLLESLVSSDSIEINGKFYEGRAKGEYIPLQGDFPQYFFPSGYIVRLMNRGGADEYFQSIGVEPDMEQELLLRMSMYSLDRLLGVMSFWGIASRVPKEKKLLFVSDRGPYSQIVTITALLEKYGRLDALDKYLEWTLLGDEFTSSILPWNPIVLTKTKDSRATSTDSELDLLERKEVQSNVTDAYLRYANKHNLPVVQVNDSSKRGWRDVLDITKDILAEANINLHFSDDQKLSLDVIDLAQLSRHNRKDYKFLGPTSLINFLYPHVDHPIKKVYDEIGMQSEKENLYKKWLYTYLNLDPDKKPFEQDLKRRQIDRKKELDTLDSQFARINASILSRGTVAHKVTALMPQGFFDQGRFLLGDFSGGHMYPFIRFMEKRHRIHGGLSRFIHNVFMYE